MFFFVVEAAPQHRTSDRRGDAIESILSSVSPIRSVCLSPLLVSHDANIRCSRRYLRRWLSSTRNTATYSAPWSPPCLASRTPFLRRARAVAVNDPSSEKRNKNKNKKTKSVSQTEPPRRRWTHRKEEEEEDRIR